MSNTDIRKDLVKRNKKKDRAAVTIDHYFALVFCSRLRQGIKRSIDPDRIKVYIIYFFENHLLDHIEKEELLILPELSKGSEIKKRTEKHLQKLKKAYYKLRVKKNSTRRIELIVKSLEDFIRCEEMTLLPFANKVNCNGNLGKLKKELSEKHQWFRNDWNDPFWKINK